MVFIYDPVKVHGVTPSTHTVCARSDPPCQINLRVLFNWLANHPEKFKVPANRFPFLSLNKVRYGKEEYDGGEIQSTASSFFMNCLVLSIKSIRDNKPDRGVSVKVFLNGSFQYTGCQNEQHMVDVIRMAWDYIHFSRAAHVNGDVTLKCRVDMINFGFNLGMFIDRPSLDFYIQQFPGMRTYYDTMINIAVNVKMLCDEPEWCDIMVIAYNPVTGDYEKTMDKEKNPMVGSKIQHTFRVFHKGTVIQSGRHITQIVECYSRFRRIINAIREHIELNPSEPSGIVKSC